MALKFMHSSRRTKAKGGFTLIEIAIVMGIVALVLGGIWVAASMVRQNQLVSQAQQQIAFIVSAYKTIYSGRGVDTTAGAVTDVTCNGVLNSFFPTDMANSATCTTGTNSTYPYHPWAGPVRVRADQPNQGIEVDYLNLPQTACIKLASNFVNTGDLMIEQVNSDSTGLLAPLGANAQMTVTRITGDCGTGNTNNVFLTFRAR